MKATPEDVAKRVRLVGSDRVSRASMKATPEDVAKFVHYGGLWPINDRASMKATPEDVAKYLEPVRSGVITTPQ